MVFFLLFTKNSSSNNFFFFKEIDRGLISPSDYAIMLTGFNKKPFLEA